MGPQEDYIETVLTCEGDYHDPQLPRRLECFRQQLKDLLLADNHKPLILKKVEPWNSVRVTFNIPREAALRLKQLAEQGSASLRRLGVLAVQIDGDRVVSLTLATPNNQHAELIIRTHDAAAQATTAGPTQVSSGVGPVAFDGSFPGSSDELGSPGPSSMEVTRKNIEEYLRQGTQLFNSILATSSTGATGTGADLPGPSNDVFKTPSHSSPAFRSSAVGSDVLAGPSGLAGFQQRSQMSSTGSLGLGTGTYPAGLSAGTSGTGVGRGPRQAGSLGVELPQTAAVGRFNMMDLPPPPPYPHGHGAGVVNNVGRQGKKMTASSPLLVNLLQTEPLAGGGVNSKVFDPDAPPKKRRRRKKKDKLGLGLDGDQSFMGTSPGGPFSSVLREPGPTAEGVNTLVNRHTSPPLPTQLSPSLASSTVASSDRGVGEGRVKSPPSASAALAAMAESQRQSDIDAGDTIINPYTGQLEPRDSASDLSPSKKDAHKPRISPSLSDSLVAPGAVRGYSYAPSVAPGVAAALDSVIERAVAADSVRHDSVLSALSAVTSTRTDIQAPPPVLSSGREMSERNLTVSSGTSLSSVRGHSFAGVIGRLQDLAHNLVSTSAATGSASAPVYAQNPSTTTHSAPATSAPLLSDSTANGPRQTSPTVVSPAPSALVRDQPTINGPVPARASPKTVSTSTSHNGSSVQSSASVAYTGNSHPLPSHVQPSVRPTTHRPSPVPSTHGHGGGEGMNSVDTSAHQHHPAVTLAEPTLHRPAVMPDKGQAPSLPGVSQATSVATPTTTSVPTDSHNLLNSPARLSPAPQPLTHTVAADPSSVNTNSPVGSKALSEADDNSNHSGIGTDTMADGTTAAVTLLDGSGTKTDNHDSGLGSASERSDDTPSEPGDSEYHTSAVTSDPATVVSTEGSGSGKPCPSVVSKGPVNCKTETTSCIEPSTITVGYVQVSEHSPHIYSKERKEEPLLKHIGHLSSQQDTSSIATGNKLLADDTVQSMAQLVKSSATLTSIASQVAMLASKDSQPKLPQLVASVAAVTTIATAVQQLQQATQARNKGIANCQVTPVHQNGPVRSHSPDEVPPHSSGKSIGLSLPAQHTHALHTHHEVLNSIGQGVNCSSPVGTSQSSVPTSSLAHSATAASSASGRLSHTDSLIASSGGSSVAEHPSKAGQISEVTPAVSFSLSAPESGKPTNVVKQHLAQMSTSSSSVDTSKPSLDSSNTPPELIAAGDGGELDILEAAQHLYHSHNNTVGEGPHSPVFEGEELVLADRTLTGFLEADVRHSATNGGGGGVSAESRAGSNITSIYSKRSSPVNVNMLNHIYAPGLPLPRRLTESVQRLVKPLPATESSLPQPRACKSPGASSSRHSSNGSSSPGRASQGGARSPGVSTTVSASASRVLSYDKAAISQAGFAKNSVSMVASMGGPASFLPTSLPLQDSGIGVSVNCCTATPLPNTAHSMPASHLTTTPYTLSAPFPVSAPLHQVVAKTFSHSTPSSYASTGSHIASLVPLPAAQTTAVAAQSSAPSTTTSLPTVHPTSAHLSNAAGSVTHDVVSDRLPTSSLSLTTPSVTVPLPHDTLPSQHQRIHSMLAASSQAASSSASGLHLPRTCELQALPHTCVAGASSSVSSSLSVSAVTESGSRPNLPPVLRLPGQTPRLSLPTTVCNSVPLRLATANGASPHRTVPSSSAAPLSLHPVTATCTASSHHSSGGVLGQNTGKVMVTVPSVSSGVAVQITSTTVHVTTHTTPSTAAVTSTTPSSSSIVKAPVQLAVSASATTTVNSPPPPTSHQKHAGPLSDQSSAPVVVSASMAGPHTLVTSSDTKLDPVDGGGVNIAQQAAKKIVVSSVGSSGEEVGRGRTETCTLETEVIQGGTQPHEQCEKCSPPQSTVSVPSAVGGSETVTQSVPVTSANSVQLVTQPSRTASSEVMSTNSSALKQTSAQDHVPAASALTPKLQTQDLQQKVIADEAGSHTGQSGTSSGSVSSDAPEREASPEAVQNSHTPSAEKPPQLQPPPPPLVPAVVPSATPPPPPLTPVHQDREHTHQAANSHLADLTPSENTGADTAVTLAGAVVTGQTASVPVTSSAEQSTLLPTSPPAGFEKASSSQSAQDSKSEGHAGEEEKPARKRTVSGDSTSSNTSAHSQQTSKQAASGMPELSSEESGRLRRITRKRKSTQSESDSSEPPQKMNSVEGAGGAGHTREKSSERESGKSTSHASGSDQPPKLQREGKRTSGTEDKEKGGSKEGSHHERNIIEATPEEIAKKLAADKASGRRRTYFTYVPEKSLTQSYFDTPVLQGRTRSQSSHTTGKDKDKDKDGSTTATAAAPATATGQTTAAHSGQAGQQSTAAHKDDGAEGGSGSKRSTRLRTKDTGDSSSNKRKRGTGKEHR